VDVLRHLNHLSSFWGSYLIRETLIKIGGVYLAKNADVINRIVAVIVDHIILWIIALIISLPLGLQAMMFDLTGYSDPMALTAMMGYGVVSLLVFLAYFTYFEGTTGQTIGKRVVNIRVVRHDGKPMTYVDAFIRTILRVIDGIALYLVGLIVILASKEKQRIGDMAAKTLVVKA
jgi:uncharacterized RDD family membrane protein YckC